MRGGTRREGMLAIAQNGTIYVNNVAEMSLALRSKLLRVMEMGTFRHVGGTQDLVTNFRILAAASSNLQARIAEGRFRSELFYRLNAFCIEVPPLRDRLTDVPLLAAHFLKYRNLQRGIEKHLGADTIAALTDYAWPGNVRELRNAIERGVIMSGPEQEITAAHVGISTLRSADEGHGGVVIGFDREPTMEEVRDHYIRMLLRRYDGHRRKVAAILGISERNTYRLVGKLEADGETGGLGGAAE
jgi:transcriptional regulator with PAS, ATPase and Fis domain